MAPSMPEDIRHMLRLSLVPGIGPVTGRQLVGVFGSARALWAATASELAAQEGIFAGISSGGAVAAALSLSREVQDAVIVAIICDRGDRYLSTGVFPD